MKYWFRPKKFWKYFACYVPTSRAGWLASLILAIIAVLIFYYIDQRSHSVSDTLINFAPWFIMILVIADSLCFRFGEYPSWWRKEKLEE